MYVCRLRSNDRLANFLFEWDDNALGMIVTRFDTGGHPTTYSMNKNDARKLWKLLTYNGFEKSPIIENGLE